MLRGALVLYVFKIGKKKLITLSINNIKLSISEIRDKLHELQNSKIGKLCVSA
jgi:hypothetical protein